MCLYQTPGRRPPPITGRFVNTVTRGWVGAANGRAPFRFHGAVGFVAGCLSKTRNLAASNKHLVEFFSGRSWPKIGPGIIFFGVFKRFETFFSNICAQSERYRNLLAGIFEIPTFYGNIAFPLSPVLRYIFLSPHIPRPSLQDHSAFCTENHGHSVLLTSSATPTCQGYEFGYVSNIYTSYIYDSPLPSLCIDLKICCILRTCLTTSVFSFLYVSNAGRSILSCSD